MADTERLASHRLPYEVIFWESHAPGYEGDRVAFVNEDHPRDPLTGWRSDRRCIFPLEIGLRLDAPCLLREVVVTSEPGLVPSGVDVFVAGPARGGRFSNVSKGRGVRRSARSTQVPASRMRADYMSSVFVRIGNAEFSRNRGHAGPFKISACLQGLSFKAQFLRLMLREAKGSYANPGRQISVARVHVLGYPLYDKRPDAAHSFRVKRASASCAPAKSRGLVEDDLDDVYADLGIEPALARGVSGLDVGKSYEAVGAGRDSKQRVGMSKDHNARDSAAVPEVALQAAKDILDMLEVAHANEMYNDAERLSVMLKRVRSLGLSLGSARQAQERASTLENFEEAKAFRDEAREADVWLRQTLRDASVIFDGMSHSHPHDEGEEKRLGHSVKTLPTKACEKPAPSHASNDRGMLQGKKNTSGTGKEAPTHPNVNEIKEKYTSSNDDRILRKNGAQRAKQYFHATNTTEQKQQQAAVSEGTPRTQPSSCWLTPTKLESLERWSVVQHLPWPAGIMPSFDIVFSHMWSASYKRDVKIDPSEDKTAISAMATPSSLSGTSRGAEKAAFRAGDLLRTIIQLVAASPDLRPPGPLPPDTAPFRLAHGSVGDQSALCYFQLSRHVGRLARERKQGGNEGGGGEGEKDGKAKVDKHGRAFAYPAADATPCATHVTNWIEDHPRIAWGNADACIASSPPVPHPHTAHHRHHKRGDHREPHPHRRQDRHNGCHALHDSKSSARTATETSTIDQPIIANSYQSDDTKGTVGRVVKDEATGEEILSGERDGCASKCPTVETTASATMLAPTPSEGGRSGEEGAKHERTPVLPNVAGAGGFSEFLPLLDAVIGRVPLSAACIGFPARMRESAIRLCDGHLELAATAAVGSACAAAALPAAVVAATADHRNPDRPMDHPAVALSTSESQTALQTAVISSGNLRSDESTSDLAIFCTTVDHESGDFAKKPRLQEELLAEDEKKKTQTQQQRKRSVLLAKGAVFRAGCLVAAQGLMDPSPGPRLAGESMAMSVLSLWSSLEGDEEIDSGIDDDLPVAAFKKMNRVSKATDPTPERTDLGGEGIVSATGERHVLPEHGSLLSGDSHGVSDTDVLCSRIGIGGVCDEHCSCRVDKRGESSLRSNSSSNGDVVGATVRFAEVAVPLRDLRWGTELLLGCLASHFAQGQGVKDPDEARSRPSRRTTSSDDERYLHQTESSNCDDRQALRIARRLLMFVCECPHLGPALAASILVSWLPDLVGWFHSTPPKVAVAVTARRGLREVGSGASVESTRRRAHPGYHIEERSSTSAWQQQRQRPRIDSCGAGHSSEKADRGCWRGVPGGEDAAVESLAAGALNMLVLMVRHHGLLPLSDFSTGTLAHAAEHGLSFTNDCNGTSTKANPSAPTVWRRGIRGNATVSSGEIGDKRTQSGISGQARRAGEALMLELFLVRGGDGIEALLPALDSARGIACLHETSAAFLAHASSNKKEGHVSKRPMEKSSTGMSQGFGEAERSGKKKMHIRERMVLPCTPWRSAERGALADAEQGRTVSSGNDLPQLGKMVPGDAKGHACDALDSQNEENRVSRTSLGGISTLHSLSSASSSSSNSRSISLRQSSQGSRLTSIHKVKNGDALRTRGGSSGSSAMELLSSDSDGDDDRGKDSPVLSTGADGSGRQGGDTSVIPTLRKAQNEDKIVTEEGADTILVTTHSTPPLPNDAVDLPVSSAPTPTRGRGKRIFPFSFGGARGALSKGSIGKNEDRREGESLGRFPLLASKPAMDNNGADSTKSKPVSREVAATVIIPVQVPDHIEHRMSDGHGTEGSRKKGQTGWLMSKIFGKGA